MGFDIDNVTTSEGDDGMDGVAVIVDEEIVVSDEDGKTIFKTPKKNHEVEVVFIQAKSGESFDLGEFLKFKESIIRFINSENYNIPDDTQMNCRSVFDIVIKNVLKIKEGKPFLTIRYVTSGVYKFPQALEAAKKEFIRQLTELGLFSKIDFEFIGRDELTVLWVSTYSGTTAELPMFSNAPLPPINGIDEAYLAVVKAKDFVERLLMNQDGSLRLHVFEENVRSFLGNDNLVNQSITETLSHFLHLCTRRIILQCLS